MPLLDKLPRFETCLFCISLRSGMVIIIMLSILIFIRCAVHYVEPLDCEDVAIKVYVDMEKAVHGLALAGGFILLLASIGFGVGLVKDIPKCSLMYMCFAFVFGLIVVVCFLLNLIIYQTDADCAGSIEENIFFFTYVIMLVVFILKVNSYRLETIERLNVVREQNLERWHMQASNTSAVSISSKINVINTPTETDMGKSDDISKNVPKNEQNTQTDDNK